jgi:transcriptional regulator with XRE-family HTH domain
MRNDLINRIKQKLQEKGMSARHVSLAAGLSETALRDLLDNSNQSPKVETLKKYAEVLDVSPGWLAFGEEGLIPHAGIDFAKLTIQGVAQEGVWLEPSMQRNHGLALVPINPDYPRDSQQAWRMGDASLEPLILDGEVVTCVSLDATTLKAGDLVVIERERDGLIQHLIRSFQPQKDGTTLLSSPSGAKPLVLDDTIRLLAVVLQAVRSLRS